MLFIAFFPGPRLDLLFFGDARIPASILDFDGVDHFQDPKNCHRVEPGGLRKVHFGMTDYPCQPACATPAKAHIPKLSIQQKCLRHIIHHIKLLNQFHDAHCELRALLWEKAGRVSRCGNAIPIEFITVFLVNTNHGHHC